MRVRMLMLLLSLGVGLAAVPTSTRAGVIQDVDVALSLGLDVSGSTNRAEFELMINGIANAFRSTPVQNAIAAGANGQIAVSLYMWNSQGQDLDIPWQVVNAGNAAAFGNTVAGLLDPIASVDVGPPFGPIGPNDFTPPLGFDNWLEPVFFDFAVIDEGGGSFSLDFDFDGGTGDGFGQTAVAQAIDFGVSVFDLLGDINPLRRVLDVAGDGFENVDFNPAGCSGEGCELPGQIYDPLRSRIFDPDLYFEQTIDARDRALAAGIILNGLAIESDVSDLADEFYARAVQGGDGSFVIAANDFSAYEAAMLQKLTQEITGVPEPSAGLLVLVAGAALALRRRIAARV